jgi:hypothetical protein
MRSLSAAVDGAGSALDLAAASHWPPVAILATELLWGRSGVVLAAEHSGRDERQQR